MAESASTAAQSARPAVDSIDTLFPDPDGVIAALVADLPAPSPERAARVSVLLTQRDPFIDRFRAVAGGR